MRRINWVGCIFAAGLGGCSLHPIPDDVSPFSTEQIVRYGRCEMRAEILDYMVENRIIPETYTADGIRSQIKVATAKLKANKASWEEKQLLRLAKVAAVYSFDFDIKEHNRTGASAGFRLPWATRVLDVEGAAALDLTRQGSRVFGAEVRWEELITSNLCDGRPWQRSGNFVYPLTGSTGVGRTVRTFIDIDLQGGAKDSFVDTLTFTTEATGGADATIKLDPVPNQFRLVSATAGVAASRLDIHKLTLSLVFPRPDPINPITGVVRVDGDLNAPFTRPADWRARYNLCVADARTRESAFRILRLEAPEVYCIRYADAFSPRTGGEEVVRVELQGAAPRSLSPGEASPARSTGEGSPAFAPAPRRIVPERRGIRRDSPP